MTGVVVSPYFKARNVMYQYYDALCDLISTFIIYSIHTIQVIIVLLLTINTKIPYFEVSRLVYFTAGPLVTPLSSLLKCGAARCRVRILHPGYK